jgi:phenylacetate-CoA ligase
MMEECGYFVPLEETLDRAGLYALQQEKFRAMMRAVLGGNGFYGRKLQGVDLSDWAGLPFTTRAELEADQAASPPYGTNLTYPMEQYVRLHQTSGSTGRPLRWLDTRESWEWFRKCWGIVYAAAGVTRQDRIFFPFSFGPFIGFWGAFEGAGGLGSLAIPGGGMTTTARLRMIVDNAVTVVCCTPTYALRMAEVAEQEGIDLAASAARALIVAGEPGGSIPATRKRIEEAWGAKVFDHTGMTEIGALGFQCRHDAGSVHLMESECIAEVIDPLTGRAVAEGMAGELVLTNLGRWGSPLIRYRTGDQVRLTRERCGCGRGFARMIGGIAGRVDDMFVIRGNNIFPSAIEALLRGIPEVAEFQIELSASGTLTEMKLIVEPRPVISPALVSQLPEQIGRRMQDTLNFRCRVEMAPGGTLPRFEMKARRVVRK